MSERRPYMRAQPRDWWAHKPYLGYTLRELTGAGVALYGGILLAEREVYLGLGELVTGAACCAG